MIKMTQEELKALEQRIKNNAESKRKLAELEKRMENEPPHPYDPFVSQEAYDMAVRAGYPTNPLWIQNLPEVMNNE